MFPIRPRSVQRWTVPTHANGFIIRSHLLSVDVRLDHRLQTRLGEGQGGHVPGLGRLELDLVARGELALFGFGSGWLNDLLGRFGRATGGAGIPNEVAGLAIDEATEALAVADRPRHRHGFKNQLFLDLVEQF